MAQAPNRRLHADHSAGILARLRAWFDGRRPDCHASLACERVDDLNRSAMASRMKGQLLSFPTRGEALLVWLADRLREKVGARRWKDDPLLLILSREPWSHLAIDRNAYVEFDPRCAEFCAVIEATPETRVKIVTSDFDAVVGFVVLYVNDRLSDALPLEVVS